MPCIVLRSGRDIGGTSGLLISLYPSIRRKRVERKKKSEKTGGQSKKEQKNEKIHVSDQFESGNKI